MPSIAVIYPSPDQQARAETLAQRYQLPCRTELLACDQIGLYVHADYLSLKQNQAQAGEVSVDFVSGKLAHRRLYGGSCNQPLARALGLHKKPKALILDATAGWGRDAWVLASLGATLYACEQQPLLCLLLNDGLERARDHAELASIAQRLHIISDNSTTWLAYAQHQHLDAIYVDPMYPKRQKSAAVKKDMQLLQALYADDAQISQHNSALLQAALAHPCKRVVVKRPINADFLAEQAPQAQIKSKHTRYDLYLR